MDGRAMAFELCAANKSDSGRQQQHDTKGGDRVEWRARPTPVTFAYKSVGGGGRGESPCHYEQVNAEAALVNAVGPSGVMFGGLRWPSDGWRGGGGRSLDVGFCEGGLVAMKQSEIGGGTTMKLLPVSFGLQ